MKRSLAIVRKFAIGLLATLLFSSCISKQSISKLDEDDSQLYPIGINGKWGFVDEFGNSKIPCAFDTVYFFSRGLSVAKLNGHYGYINKKGAWHIKPMYEHASTFNHHCAEVIKDGKTKLIDRNNRTYKTSFYLEGGCIPPPKYAVPDTFSCYQDDKYALIYESSTYDSQSQKYERCKDTTDYFLDEIIPFSASHLVVRKGSKYGLHNVRLHPQSSPPIDTTAEKYSVDYYGIKRNVYLPFDELILNYQTFAGLYEQYSVDKVPFKYKNHWGILSNRGEVLLPPIYKSVEIIQFHLAKVSYTETNEGFVNIYTKAEYFKR